MDQKTVNFAVVAHANMRGEMHAYLTTQKQSSKGRLPGGVGQSKGETEIDAKAVTMIIDTKTKQHMHAPSWCRRSTTA